MGFAYPIVSSRMGPVPYTVTDEAKAVWHKSYIDVTSNFTKGDECILLAFSVSGNSAGIPQTLDYIDRDNLPENYNRPPGDHTLNIRILTKGVYYESVAIHTRHLCGSQYVNKEYAILVNPNEG
jgi:hypothetical protein